MNDTVFAVPGFVLARVAAPKAIPSARLCMTRPRVSGKARSLPLPISRDWGDTEDPWLFSRSPKSASNSKLNAGVFLGRMTRSLDASWACAFGASCSMMSMSVKPTRRDKAICEIGKGWFG